MAETEIWKPHVTVAAVCQRDQRFLMVRELAGGREVLNQPAGHLDPGESLEQAVIRETLEETSYRFKPTALCGIYRWQPDPDSDRTYMRFAFSGELGEHLNQPLDSEIIAAEWLTLEQIQSNADRLRTPMVVQCILDYLEKPSYPLQVLSSAFL